jgi:hypothetical protein
MLVQAFWMLFRLVTLLAWLNPGLVEIPAEVTIPPGYNLIFSAGQSNPVPGLQLYQKNYPNGSPDFVQVVNLHAGAAVVPLYGSIAKTGAGQGVYGGDNPAFQKQSLPMFWQTLTKAEENPVCVLNGQFFFLSDDPTHLPFPLKKNGVIISDGYGLQDFPDQKLMLEIWPDHVQINKLTQAGLYSSSAPDIIVGLTEDANKRIKQYTGRTFVGAADRDGDGQAEILYIFNTLTARQVDAAQELREFGADQVMMLDGGGSTQLICNGNWLVRSDRWIPQAIGVVVGKKSAAIQVETVKASDLGVRVPQQASAAEATPPVTAEIMPTIPPTDQEVPAFIQASSMVGSSAPQSLSLEMGDVVWVPIVMVPLGWIIFTWVSKERHRAHWQMNQFSGQDP